MKSPLLLAALLFAPSVIAAILPYGAGSISDRINPASYGCVNDNGAWIFNAGVVEPGVAGCDASGDYNGVPYGDPTRLLPQTVDEAAQQPTGTHRWWGSVAFYGEMPIGEGAAHITPDPIMARISNRGARLMSIPAGLRVSNANEFSYAVPAPIDEVFDGLAIGNSQYTNLNAFMKNYSDGSVTVAWRSGAQPVMEATFVYGSPYVYFSVFAGTPVLRTKAPTGPEKGIFMQDANRLGVWTNVAGQRNHFLIVGEPGTQFANINATTSAINGNGRFTVAWLPVAQETPDTGLIDAFSQYALNRVDEVRIDYTVDPNTQAVTVSHHYVNLAGDPVTTLAGLMPLQWKNSTLTTGTYKTRSARGVIRFAPTAQFHYTLPFVGVLPSLPTDLATLDSNTLQQLIRDFVATGESQWNTRLDTYWTGKNLGKVAELAAIARSAGMTEEADRLINWLKGELEDWFTADTQGSLDTTKYFAYDSDWNTLLGMDESYSAHQQLNDHHFHYGYFVRAAAEICRVDKTWCASDRYAAMVELLIRDYAGGRNDPLFPYLRNFDPANGFSWASGHANFALGNNNESTSEAANAYGAMILYGLITDNPALVERGIYLHASSAAAYWEYWNNLDAYRGRQGDYNNFPAGYERITTSIIWGAGAVFSTWFSGAYAHILGIQGLPLNPLVLHVGQHADYLQDYVALGLSESSNGLPSGLAADHWPDIWWNIMAMADGRRALEDFNRVNFNYTPEAGETKAHTYHWLHSFNALGAVRSGSGDITANSPAAVVFENSGNRTYLAYNFADSQRHVTFSDGMAINVPANSFARKHSGDSPDPDPGSEDTQPPSAPGVPTASDITTTSASLHWTAAQDNVAVSHYAITVNGSPQTSASNHLQLTNLQAGQTYHLSVVAVDTSGNRSQANTGSFTTRSCSTDCGGDFTGAVYQAADQALLFIHISRWADVHYRINQSAPQNIALSSSNNRRQLIISGLADGDIVDYWFTYQNPAHPNSALDTVEYTYIHSVQGSDTGLPDNWTATAIGNPIAATATYRDGRFHSQAGGDDIWNSRDQFLFIQQTLSGDGQITARVDSLQATHAWAKAGVMMRSQLSSEASHALTAVTAANGTAFQHRLTDAGTSSHTAGTPAGTPYWLRLTRAGDVFTSAVSADGRVWTAIGSTTIAMADPIAIGLAHTSHAPNQAGEASFSQVTIAKPVNIEAENYTAFHDQDPSNNGGTYRSDAVDIEATSDTGGGYNVGWTHSGEWLDYNVTLAAGNYTLCSRVASEPGGAGYRVYLNDRLLAEHSLNSTGGWQQWTTQHSARHELTAGNYRLRLEITADNLNINWLALTPGNCASLIP